MKTNRLGRTEYNVTALGLGCFQLTGEFGVSPDKSEELMDYAMNSPINFFDTAEHYGFGESEEIVGRGAHKYPGNRVISTKVGYLHDRTVTRMLGMDAYTNPVEIKRAIKHSMWLLRQDFLPIVMIHEVNMDYWHIDYETGNSVIMTVLEELKKDGVIGNIGVGTWDYGVATKLLNTGRIDVVLAAGGMSLISRPMFDELVPAAKRADAGIVLGGGFGQNNRFCTSICRGELDVLKRSENPRQVALASKLHVIYDIAEELNVSLFELAIRYILAFEDIHTHVAGARELAHLRNNIASAQKGALDREYVDRINRVQDEFALPEDSDTLGIIGLPPGYIIKD